MRSLALMVGCIGVMLWSGLAAERSHATRTACHDLFRVKQILPLRQVVDSASVAVGRFNADRQDDIALMRFGGLQVMLAGASGGFELPRSAVARIPAWSLLAGELTGDGRTDLVAASLDGRVFVLRGDGFGNFALGPPTLARSPLLQAVGDLNSDAKPDVVLTTSEPNDAHLRVLLGDGAGALAESAAFPVAANGRAAAVVQDLDGDARPDLLLGGPAGPAVLQLLPGDGSGRFRPAVPADNRIVSIDAMSPADFNEDGRLDLAAMGFGTAVVVFGDGRGHFAEPSSQAPLPPGERGSLSPEAAPPARTLATDRDDRHRLSRCRRGQRSAPRELRVPMAPDRPGQGQDQADPASHGARDPSSRNRRIAQLRVPTSVH